MKIYTKSIKILFAIGLLVVSSSSIAIPTLNFGGNIQYSTNELSPDLNITGSLLPGHTDLSISPDLESSSIILSADFISASSDGFNTTGIFGTTSMPVIDLLISDNDGLNTLLTGNVETLLLTGREGGNFGILAGELEITGGSLALDFGGAGSLFAINFNIVNEVFNPDMFTGDFSGITNGSISSVPEPTILALLGIGLIGMTLPRRINKRR